MTNENLAPPDAGPALDAMIAEQVMGWTVNRTSDRHWHTVGPTGRERDILIGRDCCAGQHNYDSQAFCPSTDIASAWLVVEAMRERGFYFSLSNQGPERRWLAVFASDASVGDAEEISVALTICKASLATLNGVPPSEGPTP